MKKPLALLLALALAFALALPAVFAEEGETQSQVNWDDFYIVTQPQNQTVKYGENFTLTVEVNVPDGVEVEYFWSNIYRNYGYRTTEPMILVGPDLSLYPMREASHYFNLQASVTYTCKITVGIRDDNGVFPYNQRRELETEQFRVDMENKNFIPILYNLTIMPFISAIGGPLLLMMYIPPLALVYPFLVLRAIPQLYIEALKIIFGLQ
ncbi:MAG: hypothetical protein FWE98_07935 [Oscillospiraceae bacterium]|nr:hypothetical protein [Oscillospiraceae bacterium]